MTVSELDEEFEVLDSIYPDELTRVSEREFQVNADPDEQADIAQDQLEWPRLTLNIVYPDEYPNVVPNLSLVVREGELTEEEKASLLSSLHQIGEENLGMALTFTLISHLREQLTTLLHSRHATRQKEEAEEERKALLAEEARTKGTPVTQDSFKAWGERFRRESELLRLKMEEDKLKALSSKEREEAKKVATRPTGRQLFEKNKHLDDSDAQFMEDGVVSVDFSQFQRENVTEEEEGDAKWTFSDSE